MSPFSMEILHDQFTSRWKSTLGFFGTKPVRSLLSPADMAAPAVWD